jgi:hypothetical protein
MRQKAVEKMRVGRFKGSLSVGTMQAHWHEAGSSKRHDGANHMAQADMSSQISVELTSDVFGIRHQMTTGPGFRWRTRVSTQNRFGRADRP